MRRTVLALLIGCSLTLSVVGDLHFDTYGKPYTPRFGDWVWIQLSVLTGEASFPPRWKMSVVDESSDPLSVKFHVRCYYDDRLKGVRSKAAAAIDAVKGLMEIYCKRWSEDGYPISIDDDFEFSIAPFSGGQWPTNPFKITP